MARFNKAKKVPNIDAGTIQFDFAHGETLVFDVATANAELQRQAMIHGFSQKIGDAYASAETSEEAYAAAKTVIDGIAQGKWTTRVPGEGGAATMLLEALAFVSGETLERSQAVLDEMDDDQIEGLRKLPSIAAKLDELRAARAVAKAAKSAAAAAAAGPLDLSTLTKK